MVLASTGFGLRILFMLVTNVFVAAGTFTWTAPPPAWSPTNKNDIRTVETQVLNGSSNVALRWDYTLGAGEILLVTTWFIISSPSDVQIGVLTTSQVSQVSDNRFDINTSEVATLMIKDVTVNEDATYQCRLTTTSPNSPWSYNIRVIVAVETQLISVNGSQTVCEDGDVTLLCDATGRPDPNVTWTRVWKNGSDSEVLYTGKMFTLNNINRSAEGTYRCTAYNGVGKSVNHTVDITVNFPPVISPLNNQTVNESETVTLNCDPPGSPQPTVTWTNVSSGDRRVGKTWIITNINRADAGEYRCDASNECGNRTRSTFITVTYAPSILHISDNQTVSEDDVVTLNCTADGNPTPMISWKRVSDDSPVSFPLTITGKQDEGFYRCTASNSVGTVVGRDVYITVENYHPFQTQLVTSSQNNIVNITEAFNINCSAEANPPAKYEFYRGQQLVFNDTSGVGVYTTNVSVREPQVIYRCIPYNGFGDGPEMSVTLTVHYPAKVTGFTITACKELYDKGENLSITCQVEGNPKPGITWTKEGSDEIISRSKTLYVAPSLVTGRAVYNCTASNGVGAASSAKIDVQEATVIRLRMTLNGVLYSKNLTDLGSDESKNLTERIVPNISKAMNGTGLLEIMITKYGSGSVVVFFTLIFNQSIDGEMVILLLKNATSRGDFGDLGVDPSSIMLIQATEPPPSGETNCSSTFYTEDCKWKHLWTIIFVVLVVVVVLIVGVVVWWVLKIRKCRKKSPKVANTCTGEEGHVLQEFPDGAYAQVNQSYAKSGPAPANEYDQGAAGASAVPPVTYAVVDKSKKNEKPPDYAVVDKSKKKKKSGANEEKPPEDQYAVVLKSQRKKNPEEPEHQHAQVDRSMKKKHAKPGEVLYADLGEFHGNNSLPKVATSPELLPPIKKPPPAYVETQYADITQFLKGDATLPPSDGTGGVTSAAATPPGEEAGGGSSHVSKL